MPSPDDTRPHAARRRPWRWLPWTIGVALLAAVIAGAVQVSEAREFARIAERAAPWWLALAVLLQAGTYLAAGQVFRRVAEAGGHDLSLVRAFRLSLTKLFADQALPSGGLSGRVVVASDLEREGVPRRVIAAGVVVDLVSYHAAYVVSLALALGITALRAEASAIMLLVSLAFILFGVGLSVVVLSLWPWPYARCRRRVATAATTSARSASPGSSPSSTVPSRARARPSPRSPRWACRSR
jgi:Mg2+-importing ATPase